jgi:tetratricopeptide (TPR) repeat protein
MLAIASVALAQDAAKEKEHADAYKAWYDANAAKDYPKAYELAKTYLEKFPSGQYADYLKKWVVQIRLYLFNEARKQKNINEELRLANEALASDPENIDYIYPLAIDIRTLELYANPPNYTHEAQAVDFIQRSIKLIEAGKMLTGTDASKWNKNVILAFLTQTLAALEQKNKNSDKALELYKKAISLDPSVANNFLQAGSLYYEKYSAVAKKFDALPTEKKQKPEDDPEAKALLDDLNAQADAVIDSWARFLALTLKDAAKWGQTRTQIEEAAVALYKFRHPDSPTGFQDMVNKYAASAPPTN